MKVILWNELDDQQAEKAHGGQGIGGTVKDYQELVRSAGYQNPNKAYRDLGYGIFGQDVSEVAQAVNGP